MTAVLFPLRLVIKPPVFVTLLLGSILGTIGLWAATDYIPVSETHHQEHTPLANQDAKARVLQVINVWTGGPQDSTNIRCIILKIGGEAARWIVWKYTSTSATGVLRGDLVWWDQFGWEGSYTNKSAATLTNVPSDLKDRQDVTMEEVPCQNGGGFPPNLPPIVQ